MAIRLIISTILVLLLAACGWHLRGSIDLPANINSVYVDNQAGSTVIRDEIVGILQSNGVALSRDMSSADLVISLLSFKEDRRVSSVNSSTIVREYELTAEAEYEIKNAAGEILLAPDVAQLSRNYSFDQNAVISAGEEESIIKRELRLEVAQQIVRRLRFLNL